MTAQFYQQGMFRGFGETEGALKRYIRETLNRVPPSAVQHIGAVRFEPVRLTGGTFVYVSDAKGSNKATLHVHKLPVFIPSSQVWLVLNTLLLQQCGLVLYWRMPQARREEWRGLYSAHLESVESLSRQATGNSITGFCEAFRWHMQNPAELRLYTPLHTFVEAASKGWSQ